MCVPTLPLFICQFQQHVIPSKPKKGEIANISKSRGMSGGEVEDGHLQDQWLKPTISKTDVVVSSHHTSLSRFEHQIRKWTLCIILFFVLIKSFICNRHDYWWLQNKGLMCFEDTSCDYIQAILLRRETVINPARTWLSMPAKPKAVAFHIYSVRCFSGTPKSGILQEC